MVVLKEDFQVKAKPELTDKQNPIRRFDHRHFNKSLDEAIERTSKWDEKDTQREKDEEQKLWWNENGYGQIENVIGFERKWRD